LTCSFHPNTIDDAMQPSNEVLAHVVLKLPSDQSAESISAALRSAIQVGLSATVLDLKVYCLAGRYFPESGDMPPHSVTSDKDEVIEKYVHCDMEIQVYRAAGRRSPPRYFAVVVNPSVKNASGSVIDASSYAELKKSAEARAERKQKLFQRRSRHD